MYKCWVPVYMYVQAKHPILAQVASHRMTMVIFSKLFHLVSFTGFIPMHEKSFRYPFDRHICLYKAICHHPPFSNVWFQRKDCFCYFQWAEQNKSFHQSLVISLWFGEHRVSCEHCSSNQKTNCCQLLCCIWLGYFVWGREKHITILGNHILCLYSLLRLTFLLTFTFTKKKLSLVNIFKWLLWCGDILGLWQIKNHGSGFCCCCLFVCCCLDIHFFVFLKGHYPLKNK